MTRDDMSPAATCRDAVLDHCASGRRSHNLWSTCYEVAARPHSGCCACGRLHANRTAAGCGLRTATTIWRTAGVAAACVFDRAGTARRNAESTGRSAVAASCDDEARATGTSGCIVVYTRTAF